MTIEITWTGSDEYGQYIKMCLAGPPGVGKTRWSCLTAPDPLLLNAEAGTMSIADAQIPTIKISDTDDLLQVKNLLSLGPESVEKMIGFPVGTVIIDTFDEIARILISERMYTQKKDTMGPSDWSWLGDQLNAIVRGFRDLDMHVIFNCHIKDVQDGDSGATSYKLDVAGATAHQLPAAVDLAFLMHYELTESDDEDDPTRRPVIMTAPDARHEWVKDRSGKLPSTIVADFEKGFSDIISMVFEGVEIADSKKVAIEVEEEQFDPAPEDPTEELTPAEATARAAAAQETIAEAKRAKQGDQEAPEEKPSSQVVEAGDDLDLDQFNPPQAITMDGDKGFDFDEEGRVRPIAGRRWVLGTKDGGRVLSLNQLEEGVLAQPGDISSGYFCQATGVEVEKQQADISRIKFRKILCEDVFAAESERVTRG